MQTPTTEPEPAPHPDGEPAARIRGGGAWPLMTLIGAGNLIGAGPFAIAGRWGDAAYAAVIGTAVLLVRPRRRTGLSDLASLASHQELDERRRAIQGRADSAALLTLLILTGAGALTAQIVAVLRDSQAIMAVPAAALAVIIAVMTATRVYYTRRM